jgi:HlyD family secretion protein
VASVDGKTTSEVDVVVGLSDGTNTEISSGLKAGDKVVTTPSSSTNRTQNFGPFGGG